MEVGQEIRRLREEKGWSQAKLAAAADMGVSGVSQIETGSRNPSAVTLRKLARALDVEPGDLFPKAEPLLFSVDPSELGRSPEQQRRLLHFWAAYLQDHVAALWRGIEEAEKKGAPPYEGWHLVISDAVAGALRTIERPGVLAELRSILDALNAGELVPDDVLSEFEEVRKLVTKMLDAAAKAKEITGQQRGQAEVVNFDNYRRFLSA